MLVSVVITCYNLEKYIGRCIESVINQTYNNLEIIIVNDCSTDNSLKVIKEFAKCDNRIKIVNLRKNHGCGYAKRAGGDKASGDYVTFVDGDDYILSDYIEMNVNKAIEGDFNVIVSNLIDDDILDINGKMPKLTKYSFFYINTLFMKSELYKKLDFPALRYYEDKAVMPRIAFWAKNNIGYLDNYAGYNYNISTIGISRKNRGKTENLFTFIGELENDIYFNKKQNKDNETTNKSHIYKSKHIMNRYESFIEDDEICNEHKNILQTLFKKYQKINL